MRYTVVGTGGIGGLYGGRLVAAGRDVTFLARSDAEALRTDGLHVRSVDGELALAPSSFRVATEAAEVGPVDVAVVAIKTTANAALPRLLGPLVGPHTTVVVLQNGLGVEATADAAAPGAASVAGGMCFVCCMREAPGRIRHIDFGLITMGLHRGDRAHLDELAADLIEAKVEVRTVDDLHRERWRKLLWNIPFNGLSVLLRRGTDELLGDPDGRALVEQVMADIVGGAQACGAGLTLDDAHALVEHTQRMVPYRTSMALDLDARLPLEWEAIHKAAADAAAAAGRPMPTVELLWRSLATLDRANRSYG